MITPPRFSARCVITSRSRVSECACLNLYFQKLWNLSPANPLKAQNPIHPMHWWSLLLFYTKNLYLSSKSFENTSFLVSSSLDMVLLACGVNLWCHHAIFPKMFKHRQVLFLLKNAYPIWGDEGTKNNNKTTWNKAEENFKGCFWTELKSPVLTFH